ncbi:hypothetical protein GCM10010193_20530 [Kitasatospora atroaurantiaca]
MGIGGPGGGRHSGTPVPAPAATRAAGTTDDIGDHPRATTNDRAGCAAAQRTGTARGTADTPLPFSLRPEPVTTRWGSPGGDRAWPIVLESREKHKGFVTDG